MRKVTVFQDRAEVTRSLKIHLDMVGPFSAVLQGLPECLEPGSVRVESEGRTVRILDVSDAVSMAADRSLEALEGDLAASRSELLGLESNATQLYFLTSLLENYTKVRLGIDPSGGGRPGAELLELDAAAATFDFYTVRSQLLHQQVSEVNHAKRQVVKRQVQAELAIQALKDSGDRAAFVEAQWGDETSCQPATEPQDVDLTFRYIVRNASWSPSYDIQVHSGENDVELVYYGSVLQSTGEDWEDVRLSLSTSDPSRSLSPPKARKRSIHFSSNVQGDMCDSAECEAIHLHDPRKRLRMRASRNTASASVLEVPRIVTVPMAQGLKKSRKMIIGKYRMDTRLTHYATPSVSPYAYLRAAVNNTSPYPLLPSSTFRVFYDGTFVATSELKGVVGVNGTFTSFLGVDYAVKISLEPEVQRFQSSLLGGDVTTFTSTTRLINRKASRLNILIQDSVVQSMTDKIKVDIISPAQLVTSEASLDLFDIDLLPGSSLAHLDNQTGALNWAACLGPHSEITLPLIFTATTTRGRRVAVVDQGDIRFDRSSDAHTEL